jgi:hypothetical protein
VSKNRPTRKLTRHEWLLQDFSKELRAEQRANATHSLISPEHAKYVADSIDNYLKDRSSKHPLTLDQAFRLRSAGSPGKPESERAIDSEVGLAAWRLQLQFEHQQIKRTGRPRRAGSYYLKEIKGRIGWQRDEKTLRGLMDAQRTNALATILGERLDK